METTAQEDAREAAQLAGMEREQFQADGTEWVTGKANQVSARAKTPGCPHPASGGSFNAALAGEGVKTAQLRA